MRLDLLLYHVAYGSLAVLLAQSLTYVWKSRLFSLGHHGFYAVGAYTGALLARATFPADGAWFIASPSHRIAGMAVLLISMLAGALAAGLIAAILARLLRRVRGDYFAVGTLIFAEIVQRAVSNWTYVGGAMGFEVPYVFVTNSPGERFTFVAIFAVIGVVLNGALFALIRRLDASRFGLWVVALGDDDLALQSCGVDVVELQNTVFILASAVAGMCGALFLHLSTLIVPTDFSFINGLTIVLFVVLGGLNQRRVIFAASAAYAAYELLKVQYFGLSGSNVAQFIGSWREAIWGAVLILAVMVPAWRKRSFEAVPA